MLEPRQGGLRRLRRRSDPEATGQPPTRAAVRNAKIVTLPVAYAARRAGGLGRRAMGQPRHGVEIDIQARTAQHMFEVLGELKGCATKFGQLLALYELALPPELSEPYQEALSRLQDSAPAMLPGAVSAAMAANMGPEWRDRFCDFALRSSAAASVGQVHRAVWEDGRAVAVKLMYPGARESVHSDLEQIRRLAPLATVFAPGADTRALADAFADCISDELDYAKEAETQRVFADAYADDPDFVVPGIVHQEGDVLVSEWLDGIPLSRVIATGAQQEKDRIGLLVLRFVMSSSVRTGMLYSDPHPGNFRVLRDGRLGVVDFGACPVFPIGFPEVVGDLADAAFNGVDADVEAAMRRHGFIADGQDFDIVALRAVAEPIREMFFPHTIRLTKPWLREQVRRSIEPSLSNVGRQLTSPPEYTPIGRAILATVGVLAQLGTEGPLRDELSTALPGFAQALERFHLGEGMRRPVTDASDSATPVTMNS
ncbi:AarF/ABC1/UbiB kinase family protein [Nocardia sp. NBC_01503]|uniref:ABC1 kinase family protein n=1 Tax=Nocardia sp. NBC_01503 TaxID=2975997 RepID=UPI002E7BA6F5|nr:AarF/ABC1/UbiB kinase family protein [Nocardia sp. NBC_01503]WTL31595.1 AarF/ABC1/UbiB kinase family protein [Nocardia sp. NBC_01503]